MGKPYSLDFTTTFNAVMRANYWMPLHAMPDFHTYQTNTHLCTESIDFLLSILPKDTINGVTLLVGFEPATILLQVDCWTDAKASYNVN